MRGLGTTFPGTTESEGFFEKRDVDDRPLLFEGGFLCQREKTGSVSLESRGKKKKHK